MFLTDITRSIAQRVKSPREIVFETATARNFSQISLQPFRRPFPRARVPHYRSPPSTSRRLVTYNTYNIQRQGTTLRRGRLCMCNARKSREMIIRLQIEGRFEINQATGEPWRTCRSENNYFNSISVDSIHIESVSSRRGS